MKDTVKTSLRAVALLLWLFVTILASAGAFMAGEAIYVVGGILNILATAYCEYRIIINNKI